MSAAGEHGGGKETKAQRAERLKREKNPWACLEEIEAFARGGWESIPQEWLGTYFRWWGVYTQGDGRGVTGGSNGEGKTERFFMVRIRVPNGVLSSRQMRTVAEMAEEYGRGVVDITVRQNFQLHWVTIEALPELLRRLWESGLTTTAACGDDTRNITGCPLAGIDAEEICDASPLALEASRMLCGNPSYYNLPRKYKINISGCRSWCSYPELNDAGLTAVLRRRATAKEIGFSLRVGGGLSAQPHLAEKLNVFVPWDRVLAVIRGVTDIFRDSQVLRESRERARMKFLFLQHGWTAEHFQRELEKRVGHVLDAAEPEEVPEDAYRDHTGIHAQKQDGLCYVGAAVQRGRITAEQVRTAAELAERFGTGELRTTTMQNLVIIHVPKAEVTTLAKELGEAGLRVNASPFWRGTIACTGTEFCKLAITETKGFARWLTGEMEDRLPEFDQDLKLHITGCPNSCGQHWIADIGIEGKKIKVSGEITDAYYFCLGGALGANAALARPVGYRCAAAEVPLAIERLLRNYLQRRGTGENLRQFFGRHQDGELRAFLAGRDFVPVARDLPSGGVPQEVEG